MTEFLIRTSATRDWPGVHRDRVTEVLTPRGFACESISGWGDLRLRCSSAEIAFSGEEPGWHVAIEGALPNVDAFVAQVTTQVSEAVGEPCEWLRLE